VQLTGVGGRDGHVEERKIKSGKTGGLPYQDTTLSKLESLMLLREKGWGKGW